MARSQVTATNPRNLRTLLLRVLEEGSRIQLASIGKRIQQARNEAGLTQDQLAQLVDVRMRQIQNYEAGDSAPYRRINQLAEALNVSTGWILHGDAPPSATVDASAVEEHYAELAETLEDLAQVVVLIADAVGVRPGEHEQLQGLVERLAAAPREKNPPPRPFVETRS